MGNKIPSLETISNLPRDEWEDLCSSICTVIFLSHRVEDGFGKGNGLDAWRFNNDNVEGWQFRRFNSRLESNQARHIKENIKLAYERSIKELGKPLNWFTLIINIDPEPGHKGKKGEIERLIEIKEWSQQTFNLEFTFFGVSWVRTQLLKNPTLRPDLFEDLSAAISDTKQSILNGLFDIEKKIDQLSQQHELEKKIEKAFETLAREANKHFKRGRKYESQEEYIRSIESLEDAYHLLKDNSVDPQLEGRILTILAGVQTITGYLKAAIQNAKAAITMLTTDESREYLLFAKGNLAFAYYMSQEYATSEALFFEVLREFEMDGNLIEIVRTLGHITELYSMQNKIEKALEWAEKTKHAAMSLDDIIGISTFSISSMGVATNAIAAIGCLEGGSIYQDALYEAIASYEHIERLADLANLDRLKLNSKGQRARCIWHLDRLDEAAKLYSELSEEAHTLLPKLATDSKFNLALILLEGDKAEECKAHLIEARKEYLKIGDIASVADVDGVLDRHFK